MSGKKILVAPLDWGLGHTTRCIPIIRELQLRGHEVLIAADGNGEHILRENFPELQFIPLKGYGLRYSRNLPAWLKIILQLPKIVSAMKREHAALEKIIDEYQIDVVISDNRFGLWNKKVRTVYVTHQLMIKCPGGLKIFEPLLHAWHTSIVSKFDFCWIPDFAGNENLSGDLSHKYPLPPNARFIGPLSRFSGVAEHKIENDLCIMLSGPEPLRSDFEKKVFGLLQNYTGKSIVVLGRPGHEHPPSNRQVQVFSHLKTDALEKAILSSRLVICRSGYSTIMDLIALNKNALLIPTPGQTEQEYLGEYLSAKNIFQCYSQRNFSLDDYITKEFSVEGKIRGKEALKDAIDRVMDFSQNTRA